MVLEMVRANERVRYGGKGRAWDGKFVSAEVERIIQALGSALASAPSAEHPAVVDEAAARRLDVRAAARAAALGDHWEHMGEPAREAMRQRVRDEEGAT